MSMAVTYVYRTDGGRIFGSTISGAGVFQGMGPNFATVTDPEIAPDTDFSGNLIYKDNVLRNATESEWSYCQEVVARDEEAEAKQRAIQVVEQDLGSNGRVVRCAMVVVLSEVNELRAALNLPPRAMSDYLTKIRMCINEE